MKQIIFTVPAVPVAQPRARASSFGGHARIYNDSKHPVMAFKAAVMMAFSREHSGEPLTGPLRCDITFVMQRPKGLIWKSRPMPRAYHAKKPDRDNLDKAVLDSLKSLAWADDAQVCQGEIQKWIAAGDEQPHVVISIIELEGV